MSLRLRLLLVIGISLSVLWSIMAGWLFLDMRRELQSVLDNRLQASAQMVAGLIEQMPRDVLNMEPSQPQIDIATLDGLACEVSIMRGQITSTLLRTQGGPVIADVEPGFGTYVRDGNVWRVYVLQQSGLRIAVADRMGVRSALLRDMALSVGLPFAFALIGSLILVWWATTQGLRPFDRVRAALAGRDPADLTPLPAIDAPADLQPLIDTVHELLQRVAAAIRRERRFTDDAAHELRTPLTAVRTHLQVARIALSRGNDTQLVQDSVACAEQGAVRLQETLDQLLLLARLDSNQPSPEAQSTTVADAARQALAELEPLELDAGSRVSLVEPPGGTEIAAVIPASLLTSALRNLLDNALRYSPQGSPVTVELHREPDLRVRIRVRDQGPGLAAEDIPEVAARFWRAQHDGAGSGLGLSIVQLIAEKHRGSFSISNHRDGGLVAELVLPAADDITSVP